MGNDININYYLSKNGKMQFFAFSVASTIPNIGHHIVFGNNYKQKLLVKYVLHVYNNYNNKLDHISIYLKESNDEILDKLKEVVDEQ